jgi:hypothetical protein
MPCATSSGIDHAEAEHSYHANRGHDAYERAVIVLRLLLGEAVWDDGYERRLDDCFENGDGDAVCGWLLEFAEADARIHTLLATHYNTKGSFQVWLPKYRHAHRTAELPLS